MQKTIPKPKNHSLSFEAPDPDGGAFKGEVWVTNARQGRIEHVVASGRFTDGIGVVHTINGGTLSGVSFVEPKRGAPRTKRLRDVAAYLAWRWFLAGTARDKKAQADAYSSVVDLWAEKRWKGISEQAHARRSVNAGRDVVRSAQCDVVAYKCDPPVLGGLVFAAKPGACSILDSGDLRVDGEGYFWLYGAEQARFARTSNPILFPNCGS